MHSSTTLPAEIFLVGCGYVGTQVAQRLHDRKVRVHAWVRTEQSRLRLADLDVPSLVGDVGSPEAWESLTKAPDCLLYGPSSSRGGPTEYRNVFLRGLSHALRRFPGCPLLFLSSTSVYGQSNGELVDEEAPAAPDSETGHILREAEEMTLEAGGMVLRIAGIYGPGRTWLLDRFLSGQAAISTTDRWINQIHRDDVVSAILHFLALPLHREIVNIVDDEPVREGRFYEWLAGKLNRSLPPQGEGGPAPSKRRRTHKRVSNAKARGLGWKPLYPSFREGLLPILLNQAILPGSSKR
ncbi:MAG: NAD-dependent epimerase/dehydratase family protein [Candidatus Methylacidiphilaceae bacterium]